MKFSIITPSFRNSNWLKLCIASVADQLADRFTITEYNLSADPQSVTGVTAYRRTGCRMPAASARSLKRTAQV